MKSYHGKISDCPEGFCIKEKLGPNHWEIEKKIDFNKLQETLKQNTKLLVGKLKNE